MAQEKQTLGQAIDQLITALEPLDSAARNTALRAVCAHLQVELFPSGHGPVPSSARLSSLNISPSTTELTSPTAASLSQRIDIRTLKEQKRPASGKQMACLVAYYLQEHAPESEKKDAISAADLEKYFKQAGFKLPTHLRQVLPDAKSSGYFDSAGRGEYKLNAVGYNLVVHNLPSAIAAD